MSADELQQYSKDQLIAELINRQTFAGLVIFHRGDAKAGRLEPGETVITKSPPLTRQGVEGLLRTGLSLVPTMFAADATSSGDGAAELPAADDYSLLRLDEGGVIRIGKSRVTLDLVVEQYENGMAPEAMARAYDSLLLPDIYASIGYYLRHRDAVLAYLKRRAAEADELRSKIEAECPRISRAELRSRRDALETDHAPARK
jgi:uncharacterized protein (DUF433 family)